MKNKIINCFSCFKSNLGKDEVALNKKLLGKDVKQFYCMECLANYLDSNVDDLKAKIEEFKEEGCTLFN